jgi:hypothetical protein
LILLVVATTTIVIVSQIGYIADFVPEQISSNVGVAAFTAIVIIFAVTQYFILAARTGPYYDLIWPFVL